MKKLHVLAWSMVMAAGSINMALADDYSSLTTEQMLELRSQVRELSPEERNSYRTEMQNRMQSMSSEERALFRETNQLGGQQDGTGKMNRHGQGNSSGSGSMNRYGQGSSQGYGSGYGSRSGGGSGGGRGRGRGR